MTEKKKNAKKPSGGETNRPITPERKALLDRLSVLAQKRDNATEQLRRSVAAAKAEEQRSLVLRGRISVYEEDIEEIEKALAEEVSES